MNEEVEIIISEMRLNGTAAIRIMKCLKEHEPEIWQELKETLKQKLPIHDVVSSLPSECQENWESNYYCTLSGKCQKCEK